jgi:hypothetical protein
VDERDQAHSPRSRSKSWSQPSLLFRRSCLRSLAAVIDARVVSSKRLKFSRTENGENVPMSFQRKSSKEDGGGALTATSKKRELPEGVVIE